MGALGISIGTPVESLEPRGAARPGQRRQVAALGALAVAVILLMRRVANPLVLPLALARGRRGLLPGDRRSSASASTKPGRAACCSARSAAAAFSRRCRLAAARRRLAGDRGTGAEHPDRRRPDQRDRAAQRLGARGRHRTRIDPDRDLRGIGLCNLAAAACGGPVGYHVLSETLLAPEHGLERPGQRDRHRRPAAWSRSPSAPRRSRRVPVGSLALLILVVGLSMLHRPARTTSAAACRRPTTRSS